MPTSDPRQIAPILAELQRLNPRSVLDAGAGYGKYGVLVREYLDDWQGRLVIDGIEGFYDYFDRSQLWSAYNEVHFGSLDDADWWEGREYDAILLIDVLEHFEWDAGLELLRKLALRSRYLLIATPREPADQGDPPPYDNDLETHRSQWTERDFSTYFGFALERFVPVPGDEQLVVVLRGVRWGEESTPLTFEEEDDPAQGLAADLRCVEHAPDVRPSFSDVVIEDGVIVKATLESVSLYPDDPNDLRNS